MFLMFCGYKFWVTTQKYATILYYLFIKIYKRENVIYCHVVSQRKHM